MNTLPPDVSKEFDDSFPASNDEQTHIAYPFRIYPEAQKELKSFLAQKLAEEREKAYEEMRGMVEDYYKPRHASASCDQKQGFCICSNKERNEQKAVDEELLLDSLKPTKE